MFNLKVFNELAKHLSNANPASGNSKNKLNSAKQKTLNLLEDAEVQLNRLTRLVEKAKKLK